MTTEEKTASLAKIAQEISAFKGLDIAKNCTHPVPGEGNPDALVLFVGEGPGATEDLTGRPFVGQAGKLLEKALSSINLTRSDVYITNVVKFRPPDNRDPFPEEIAACASWLDKQIDIIRPKIIATLGRFSMAKFIPDVTISKVHGQSRFVDFLGQRYIIFPMYHPAAALRSGDMMSAFMLDFAKLGQLLVPAPVVSYNSPPPPAQTSLF